MEQGYCPECSHRFKLKLHPKTGMEIVCPRCKVKLVVTSVSPLDLDLAITGKTKVKTKQTVKVIEAACPECDYSIKLKSRIHEDDTFACESCGADLEVVSANPIELDLALPHNFKQKHPKR